MIDSKVLEILLVEDSPQDLELALRALKRSHLANRIHVARDGEEALNFFFGPEPQEGFVKPRLILLDLKLPKVDGIEVLQRLKADSRTHDIPVVVLTSSREPNDLSECYRLGVNSYIVKPVNFEQFYDAVHQLGMYWLLLNESMNDGV